MSTELHNRQDAPLELMPEAVGDMRAAIVTARFNSDITYALRDAALKTFKDAGIDDSDVDTFEVPGAVELTFAASQLIESGAYDVVILLRRRHNNSLITADIYTRGGSRVRVYDLYPIGAGIHQV